MKNKIFLALLACVVAFSFAACSDDEQDVNIVSTIYTSNEYYYKVTGTFKIGDTTHTVKTMVDTIEWSTNVNSNATEYSIGSTSLESDTYDGYVRFSVDSLYKIGGTYYDADGAKVTGLTGDLEGDSFTLAGILKDVSIWNSETFSYDSVDVTYSLAFTKL